MNDIYLWCVTGVTGLVALNTVWRLFVDHDRLAKEDLTDEDRTLAWRIVVFVIFPLINLLDLRATVSACELLGGYIKSWNYGLLWYHAIPAGLHSSNVIIPVLFAGSLASTLFALCLIPALFFRPHPFLATVIGYTSAFVLGLNFIVDPLLSLVGMGTLRWQVAFTAGSEAQRMPLLMVHLVCAVVYLLVVRNNQVRFWFSSLARPHASAQLKQALLSLKSDPESARLNCLVGLLYEKAGLRYQAKARMKKLQTEFPYSPYCHFLSAVTSYWRRDYKSAKKSFIFTSDYPYILGDLKASLLAGAACCAFAENDLIGALNLCERALEFDHESVLSRMVKVDVYLRQGKKQQAADEILAAMRMGLDLNLEDKIPVDLERAYNMLVATEESKSVRHILQPTNTI